MEKVDLVIVGAEGVVENGGIINKVGAQLSPGPSQGVAVPPTWVTEAVLCCAVQSHDPA